MAKFGKHEKFAIRVINVKLKAKGKQEMNDEEILSALGLMRNPVHLDSALALKKGWMLQSDYVTDCILIARSFGFNLNEEIA